jgi:hypothetical protein
MSWCFKGRVWRHHQLALFFADHKKSQTRFTVAWSVKLKVKMYIQHYISDCQQKRVQCFVYLTSKGKHVLHRQWKSLPASHFCHNYIQRFWDLVLLSISSNLWLCCFRLLGSYLTMGERGGMGLHMNLTKISAAVASSYLTSLNNQMHDSHLLLMLQNI